MAEDTLRNKAIVKKDHQSRTGTKTGRAEEKGDNLKTIRK